MFPYSLKSNEYRNLRKWVLQFCYQQEINQDFNYTEKTIQQFIRNFNIDKSYEEDFKNFVSVVFKYKTKSDTLVEKFTKNWKISRIAKVDLVLLRVAIAEFMEKTDSDAAAIISETLTLSEEFSSENSFAFLNGILDSVLKEIKKTSNKE